MRQQTINGKTYTYDESFPFDWWQHAWEAMPVAIEHGFRQLESELVDPCRIESFLMNELGDYWQCGN